MMFLFTLSIYIYFSLLSLASRQADVVQKQMLRYGNIQVSFLIFFLYYGVPILTVELGGASNPSSSLSGDGVVPALSEFESAGHFLKTILFPVSTFGMGVRMARWGMSPTEADASIGALVVFWAGQVTAGKLMDAVEAYCLYT